MTASERDPEKGPVPASDPNETNPLPINSATTQVSSQDFREKTLDDRENPDHEKHGHEAEKESYDDDDEDDDEDASDIVDGEKSKTQARHLAAPPSNTSGRTPQLSRATSILDGGVLGEPSAWVDEDQENERDVEAGRPVPLSRAASSVRSKPLSIVPRKNRRGLFGKLALLPEVERPYDYPDKTKWSITGIIAFAAMAAPMGSSIFYPALESISHDLHTTPTTTNLSVAFYMLSMAIFPMFWSSFSEQFGRRTIYLISFAMFVVFSVLCAVSNNIIMLIIFRLCSGATSASVQAVGAGTIADIWESFERGRAMGIFYLGPLLGPLFAPIIGGVLAQELGWQATMWFLAIYGLLVECCILLFLPETLTVKKKDEPASGDGTANLQHTTTRESAVVKSKKMAGRLKRYLLDPFKVIYFLRFPPVLITVLIAAEAFGALYVVNIALQQKYAESPYHFSELIIGITYVAPGLGYMVASILGGRWIDSIMAREARKANRYDEKGKLIYLPEDRMRENMWLAHAVYPLALLGFGWSLKYGVFWFVPEMFLFFFGVASMLVFSAATTMLTEFVRKKSSAGVAVNNLIRNILSCVALVVASMWIDAINVGWVFTIICLFCIVFGNLGIWMLRRNATKWRHVMDEALKDI